MNDMQLMWQWISDQYGPMGHFTDADKQEVDATRPFTGGHWREVPPEEVAAFYRWAGQLAYSQA